jgi:hypothetical protein
MFIRSLPVDEAANKFKVDPDILHRFYKQYLRSKSPKEIEVQELQRKKEFKPINHEIRENFNQNWGKAQEEAEKMENVSTPLAESFSRIPILRRVVKNGEVNSIAVFELIAVFAVLAIAAVVLLVKKETAAVPPKAANAPNVESFKHQIEVGLATVTSFLSAKDWQERAAFVRDSDRVKPLMKEWYEQHPEESGPFDIKYKFFEVQNSQFGETFLLYSLMNDVSDNPRSIAVESKRDQSCLVDWESFVGYQSGNWDYFIENRNEDESVFRVEVEPSNYYNYAYTDTTLYVSLQVTIPNSPRSLYLYLDRTKKITSEIGNALLTQTPFGDKNRMTLRLTFANTDSKETEVVRVTEMISPTWIAP